MHRHDTIDRITPTLEPDRQVLLHQNWHHLLFLHWEIPPGELQALLPPRLTLDTFEGKAYIGLVPFTMTGVRPILTPPLPWISSFHEVNVRTYVHCEGRDPGVWFFSLDASSRIAVAAARAAYHLAYFEAEMDLRVGKGALPVFELDSRRTDPRGTKPANAHVRYRALEGPVQPATPGTLEHFLIERYILYARSESQLYRARVHHTPYVLLEPQLDHLEETLIWAAGIKRPDRIPLMHYSPGVSVEIFRPEKVG